VEGVLQGFSIVLLIAGAGYLASAFRLGGGADPKPALTQVIYYITNPALMFVLLADSDLGTVFGVFAPVALLTAAATGLIYAILAVTLFRRNAGTVAVGAMSASYVNAGNIGLPIALYAVGSSVPVVSVLIAQLLVVAPVYIGIFSWAAQRRAAAEGGSSRSLWRALLTPFANPVTLATAAGLAVAASGAAVPDIVWNPVELVGHASVPLLLLVFGMSLFGHRPLARKDLVVDTLVATGVKLLLMPALGYAAGRWVFGLEGVDLLGVVVMSALPTAQNVFLFSGQFRMDAVVARDVVFFTSLLSFPVILAIALALT
jgi:malonate transporter and related proteins